MRLGEEKGTCLKRTPRDSPAQVLGPSHTSSQLILPAALKIPVQILLVFLLLHFQLQHTTWKEEMNNSINKKTKKNIHSLPRNQLSMFHTLFFNLHNNIQGLDTIIPIISEKQSEDQRDEVIFPGRHSLPEAEPRSKPQLAELLCSTALPL